MATDADRQCAIRVVRIACHDAKHLAQLRSSIAGPVHIPELRDAGLLLAICIAIGDCDRLRMFEVIADDQPIGWLFAVIGTVKATLHCGPIALFEFGELRLRIKAEYGFIAASSASAAALGQALVQILRQMGAGATIHLQAVPADSPLSDAVEWLRKSEITHVRAEYPKCARHRLKVDGDFSTYLQSLSKSTRQTFRYSLKKLRDHCQNDVTLCVFDAPETVDNFVREASLVAQATYQQMKLGLGFTNTEGVKRRLQLASQLGWMKSFVLRCQGIPVAYIEGYQAGGTWFAYQIGFAPDWSKLSVGTVCQLEALKHLMDTARPRPRVIDYLEGDTDFKRRLCNVTTTETSVLITIRSARASALFYSQVTFDMIFYGIRRLVKVSRLLLGR